MKIQDKEKMREMIKSGMTQRQVSEEFKVSLSTVQYNISEDSRNKAIERAKRNQKGKKRKPRTKYMREYMKNYNKKKKEEKKEKNNGKSNNIQ